MKNITKILLLISFLYSFSLIAQKDTIYKFGEDQGDIEYFFGFNLIPSAMGGLVHFVLIKPGQEDKKVIKQLTKDNFVYQAMGKQQSIANPNKIDFFEKYQINNPTVIDDLWKLRYKEYPYFSNTKIDPGWSSNDSIPFLPTENQMKVLEKFGLYKLNDYIFGENAFKLLYLMGKPEWVKSYIESY